jgi:uncharacterized protein YqgV (UPF0045/DUF77 family)
MIEANLKASGIDCAVFPMHHHVETLWLDEVEVVRVWVPRPLAARAEEVVSRLRVSDDEDGDSTTP